MEPNVYISDVTRKLASIQKISELRPIEGADRIEVAMMEGLGWECVVKKDELKVGDTVVYFEVDSILPEKPEYEFLRERKFRIKTIKLKKQVSQGLIVPRQIAIPGYVAYLVGTDVTELLGVKKHDPQGQEEQSLASESTKTRMPKFLMNMFWFRWIYFKLNPKTKGCWPSWIQKTDEDRIQVCLKTLMNHYNEPWYITEKMDGSSATYFTYFRKKWGFKFKQFGVASRNIWLKTSKGRYGLVADKYKLEDKLTKDSELLIVQGEMCGPGIQKNKYGFEDLNFFVFNIIKNGNRLDLDDMVEWSLKNDLTPVPMVNPLFFPSKEIGLDKSTADIIHYLVNLSKGNSIYGKTQREGIVVRLRDDPSISFKVINPEFLLKNDE